MEPSGYLSNPFSLSQGNYFDSNNVLNLMITALDITVPRVQIPDSINLLQHVFNLIKPENAAHIEKIPHDRLIFIFQLVSQALKNFKCNQSKANNLNQILFSQMLLSMRLMESPQELIEHSAYHGIAIRNMIFQISQELGGSVFDVAKFLNQYVQFIFKTTPKQENSKIFLIRDSLIKNPHFKNKTVTHCFTIAFPSNSLVLNERVIRNDNFGVVTWSEVKKDFCSFNTFPYPSFKDLQNNFLKGKRLIPARKLTILEQNLYVHLIVCKNLLVDPYRKFFFEDPIIDGEGNTYSKLSLRGDLRSASHQKDDNAYRPNHLIVKLLALLNRDLDSLENTFGELINLLSNPTTETLIDNPVVGLDGNTYEKGQLPDKDVVPNKKVAEILAALKKSFNY